MESLRDYLRNIVSLQSTLHLLCTEWDEAYSNLQANELLLRKSGDIRAALQFLKTDDLTDYMQKCPRQFLPDEIKLQLDAWTMKETIVKKIKTIEAEARANVPAQKMTEPFSEKEPIVPGAPGDMPDTGKIGSTGMMLFVIGAVAGVIIGAETKRMEIAFLCAAVFIIIGIIVDRRKNAAALNQWNQQKEKFERGKKAHEEWAIKKELYAARAKETDELNAANSIKEVAKRIAEKRIKQFSEATEQIEKRFMEVLHSYCELMNQNVIYPKYRGHKSCEKMLEYLESARVKELEGPCGAYNLLELETRLDQIIAARR